MEDRTDIKQRTYFVNDIPLLFALREIETWRKPNSNRYGG